MNANPAIINGTITAMTIKAEFTASPNESDGLIVDMIFMNIVSHTSRLSVKRYYKKRPEPL